MKWFLLVLATLSLQLHAVTPPEGGEDEHDGSVPILAAHLAAMDHLSQARGLYDKFQRLLKSDEQLAWFVSNLWRTKVRMEHDVYLTKIWTGWLKANWKMYEKMSESDRMEHTFECQKFVYIAYYLDHIEEITKMIDDQLQLAEKIGEPKKDILNQRLEELAKQRDEWHRQNGIRAEKR